MKTNAVRFGLDVCLDKPSPLDGRSFALLLNQASVGPGLTLSCDLMRRRFPTGLKVLLTPQHGMWGTEQANMVETPHAYFGDSGLRMFSLYSETRSPTSEMLADVDCLVIDLQDVGTRVYTFVWTATCCLEVAAKRGIKVFLLDRPNPIGAGVEGPLLDMRYASFVGRSVLPMRHGVTMGELLLLLNQQMSLQADLNVIALQGWRRSMSFDGCGRCWIPPSPNLPTIDSCDVYPGQVLLEGTNLSEGRGTTRPFEVVGAPYVNSSQLLSRLADVELPGVVLRPTRFRPTFDKWRGEVCEGVSLHVTHRESFNAYRTSVAIIAAIRSLWPRAFAWSGPPYEYEQTKMPIDVISGSPALRRALDDGRAELNNDWLDEQSRTDPSWSETIDDHRLYLS